jgi:hypothetical protein
MFIENINCSEKFATKDKLICSQQALTILLNICIIYLSFSVRYTGSKTILSLRLRVVKQKNISNFQGQAVFGRANCQGIVTEDN